MAKRITNHSRYVNGAEDGFCPAFLRKRAFLFAFPLLLCNLSIFAGSDENFFRRRLTAQRTHAILTVLTHLIQQEAPMFHLIFLIPVLVVLLLGILLLAVLCSR